VASAGFSAADAEHCIPRLRRYALALTGTREAADDLTQDTLERAWRKRTLWQPGTDLRAWLFTVMHNVYVNRVRSMRITESLDDAGPAADAVDAMPGGSAADSGVVLGELKAALGQLAPEQREVVLLVGLEQLSYVEAATALDIPVGTVMSRLSRGRERLRQLLDAGARTPVASGLRRVK
jgi:RNA polymerase sigma-70 factor (ECF subfamily)